MNTTSNNLAGIQLTRSLLLFFGAFLLAFILNSYVIHEAGHAFGGMLFGCKIEKLDINPFGTGSWESRCPSTLTMGQTGTFLQGMGGPIFGLPISIAITIILWRRRRPVLLPLLMSAPVVCIANFLGVLDSMLNYPGHIFDYGLMLQNGVSPSIIWLIGIVSLVIGVILMNLLVPLTGLGIHEPFWKVLLLNLFTWPLYLLIRLFYQIIHSVESTGPMSLLILGVILAVCTALPFKPILKFSSRFINVEPVIPSSRAVWLSFGPGIGLAFVLTLINPI